MTIDGVWKGRYLNLPFMFETGKEVSVPFMLRINCPRNGAISLDRTLFEGICIDDPEITKIDLHAKISGSLDRDNIYFLKQYPKLIIHDLERMMVYDNLQHPEIFYSGELKGDEFKGTWIMHSTFRNINGHLTRLKQMKGTWWMRKL